MRKYISIFYSLTFLAFYFTANAQENEKLVLITNAKIFKGTDKLIEGKDVLIRGNKIVQIAE